MEIRLLFKVVAPASDAGTLCLFRGWIFYCTLCTYGTGKLSGHLGSRSETLAAGSGGIGGENWLNPGKRLGYISTVVFLKSGVLMFYVP